MKNNVIKIIFTIITLGLFITTIILTNDSVKENLDTGKLLPIVVITLLILICIILMWGKKSGKGITKED